MDFFLEPGKIEQMFISIKVLVNATRLSLVCKGICIGK